MDEVSRTSKARCPWAQKGTACHPNGPKHSLPQLVSPKQADPRLLGCSEGIWEIQQMAPQKCCFPFGGRIREQRGLVHLCVWRWRLAGSPARLLLSSGSHLPWDGPAFEPGLAKQVLTTTTHPAGNLSFLFLIRILLSLLTMIWDTVKLESMSIGGKEIQYM